MHDQKGKEQLSPKKFRANIASIHAFFAGKKGKGHPCTGTEALYRPYGP
jgi:hypothetical protein